MTYWSIAAAAWLVAMTAVGVWIHAHRTAKAMQSFTDHARLRHHPRLHTSTPQRGHATPGGGRVMNGPATSAEVYAVMCAADPNLPAPDLVSAVTIQLEPHSVATVAITMPLTLDAAVAMAETLAAGAGS